MPDTPRTRAFTRISNYPVITQALGVEVPGDEAAFEQVIDYRTQITSHGRQTGFPRVGFGMLSGFDGVSGDLNTDTNATLGFDSRHLELIGVGGTAFVGGRQDPTTGNAIASGNRDPIEIVVGRIEAARAHQFLGNCEGCALEPEIVDYQGNVYHTWGWDQNLRASYGVPLFDAFGRGGSLYFEDGVGVRTPDVDQLQPVIDTITQARSSLADLESWRLAARAVEDLGSPSAVFTDVTNMNIADWPVYAGLTLASSEELADLLEPEIFERFERFDQIADEVRDSAPSLPEFELVASGTGWENERTFSALAVVFADQETAEEAAMALRARAESGLTLSGSLETVPWVELIDSAEIEVRGRVVTAKVFAADSHEEVQSSLSLFVTRYPFAQEVPYVQFLLR